MELKSGLTDLYSGDTDSLKNSLIGNIEGSTEEPPNLIDQIKKADVGSYQVDKLIEGVKYKSSQLGNWFLSLFPEEEQEWWREKGLPHLQAEWEYKTQRSKDKTGLTGSEAFAILTSPAWIPAAIKGKVLSQLTRLDDRITTFFGAGLRPKHLGITQTISKLESPKALTSSINLKRNVINQINGTSTKGLIKDFTYGSIKKSGLFDKNRNDATRLMWTSSASNANYDPIEGSDDLTISFKPKWLNQARTGEKTYYYDITNHRILNVPGMENIAEQTRYRQWLTQSLINRLNQEKRNPGAEFTYFTEANLSFYDTKGMEWRLVRRNKEGKGAWQPYEPMPLNEIDSRKLKAKNSPGELVTLNALLRLNVRDRNRLERANPALVRWNSDFSGQNYHEHMIGLDESEFWNSGYGKSLGYFNNDVFDIEKGIGNIVFLNDPRFKIMKDEIAGYITPAGKEEVYPGLRRRTEDVKTFTDGPYKGFNAVVGYDADPRSETYTDLVIYAYDPSPDKINGIRVTTIPNYYSSLYAKDANGNYIIAKDVRDDFIQGYIDSVLRNDIPSLIRLEDIASEMFDVEIPAPLGLQQMPLFQGLGEPYYKPVDSDPKGEKVFKTTPKIQREYDKRWRRLLMLWQKGPNTQLELKFPPFTE